MKKLCLAGFWIMQYVFGVWAIVSMKQGFPVPDVMPSSTDHAALKAAILPYLLLLASFGSTMIGGKLLGIGAKSQREADETVPRSVDVLWQFVCKLTIALLMLSIYKARSIVDFPVSFTGAHAFMLFYATAAFRDSFLIRYYFSCGF